MRPSLLAVLGLLALAAAPAHADLSAEHDPEIDAATLECMALNIYWEANRSNELDLRAVAHVTVNRMADPAFPSDVCSVVTQGGERPLHGCQFSWWCDGRSDQPTDARSWRRALGIAEEVLTGQDEDLTDGALFFHNTSVSPDWADELTPTLRIGNHIFYAY